MLQWKIDCQFHSRDIRPFSANELNEFGNSTAST